jgi:molybdopterin-guanine dinucleotide biosynthesis protein A
MIKTIGIILAGGRSSRMGKDKATLCLGEKTLLQQMESLLVASGVDAVAINNKQHIADEIVGKGPLSGIHATLKAFQGQQSYLIYVPVDMPALTPTLIQNLIEAPAEYAVVRFTDYILPFRLTVNTSTVELIEKILAAGQSYSLGAFQRKLTMKLLPVNLSDTASFININTPEAWQDYNAGV